MFYDVRLFNFFSPIPLKEINGRTLVLLGAVNTLIEMYIR